MSNLKNDKTSDANSDSPNVGTYWQDVENKVLDKKHLSQEFKDDEFDSFSVQKNRRSFLKIMGFSVAALPLTSCIKIPVKKAIPYLNKENDSVPGVANWYASTFDGIPVLVKTREGRPIKIEGNDKSLTTFGGASARAQASVLSLYDENRKKTPTVDGKNVNWPQFDKALSAKLKMSGGKNYIVTSSMSSPSELTLITEFSKQFNFTHVVYEPVSFSAQAKANELTHGSYSLSEYDFEKADFVVSLGADFLGSWGNDVANAKGYGKRRKVDHENGMNKHYHFESTMSLTGSNADYRYTVSHSEQKNILLALYAAVTGTTHKISNKHQKIISDLAAELLANKGRSLVVCGCNEIAMQVLVNKINSALGNYESSISVYRKKYNAVANDELFENLVSEMDSGQVNNLFLIDVNPVYSYYNAEKFKSAFSKVKNTATFTASDNETSSMSQFVANSNHVYESWSDSMVSATELSLTQPVLQGLFGTRMWTESLMSLMGRKASFYDYMKKFWSDFGLNWNQVLHDGVAKIEKFSSIASEKPLNATSYVNELKAQKTQEGLNLITYVKYGIGNGDMTNNPFLQEMPDPVTKATWDNYALISPAYAKANKLTLGDIVEVSNGRTKFSLPVIIQPGTEENTVAMAVGYGRKVAGKVARNLGVNAYGLHAFNKTYTTSESFGTLKKTGMNTPIAQTQTHHSMEGRDIIRETTLKSFKGNPKAGNEVHKPKTVHIYPAHKRDGHQWSMSVDLTSCTGCSSCIVSCSAENNVPVVGKQEVINRREMHWLRLDRYYKGDEAQPEVSHMPMLCQHCDNAPCENVCPVLATSQSSDGMNMQTYNRCVGTRYCANNCPYKVRRFNWFNYDRSNKIEKMALNPDVSIRTRGIMEKCSMCVQRVQEGKLNAKRDRRKLKDGDIQLACQQSCPTDSITFGDLNDPNSKIAKISRMENNMHKIDHPRGYAVLEELNVQPRVSYLTKIRNK
jgi:molybdopterin-containing oxidoreductase family iron-sulfur binding subunit